MRFASCRSCVRERRRASSSDFLPAATSAAVKPSRAARASSSRIAVSTRARFSGAKIAATRNDAARSKALAVSVLEVL